ncbi:MAG: exonuclease SbcCD subunit D C-terminal domain-containing protein [Bradymonadales bacterium]|nr:exonuclease SbcCD subunit D C-terminal domain-containing protein [Bradymonadales bacterium]
MFRFIHTADWHLGHRLRDFPRDVEHRAFLDWLLERCKEHQVDALLIAGDIFDCSNPSAEAQATWYRFLARVIRDLPDIQVVAIAGNHDSAGRLNAPRELLEQLNIRVVGNLVRKDGTQEIDANLLRFTLQDSSGDPAAVVVAIPYLRESDLPRIRPEAEDSSLTTDDQPQVEGTQQDSHQSAPLAEDQEAQGEVPAPKGGHKLVPQPVNRSGQGRGLLSGGIPEESSTPAKPPDQAKDPLIEGVREIYRQVIEMSAEEETAFDGVPGTNHQVSQVDKREVKTQVPQKPGENGRPPAGAGPVPAADHEGVDVARQGPDGRALIAMGHCYAAGTALSELSERKILGGNLHALPADVFGSECTYVALGHLHKAQQVGCREEVRYSGSPIPLSMGEKDYRHQVCLVEMEGARIDRIQELEIPRMVQFHRIPERGVVSKEEALKVLRDLPESGVESLDGQPFLQVDVRLDRPEPGLRAEVDQALENKGYRLIRLGVTYTGDWSMLGEVAKARGLEELDPEEVFRLRWTSQYESEPEEEILSLYRGLVDLAQQEAGS